MAEEFDRLRETAQIDNFLANTSQSGKKAVERSAAAIPRAAAPPAVRQATAPGKVPALKR
jgi:hypothetical protein